jgi:hypothetical protein
MCFPRRGVTCVCIAPHAEDKLGRPLTETTSTQDKLIQVFQLDRHAPEVRS